MAQLLKKAERWLAPRLLGRSLPLAQPCGVVSFSFDDAPRSACHEGRAVLEQQGCHGTWYLAGGLTDQPEQGRLCHSLADAQSLHRAGHHIGCHTFSHQPSDQLPLPVFEQGLQRNAAFLAEVGLDTAQLDFSFPLGAFSYASMRLAAQRFRSSRITGGGMQAGQANLSALTAERLYQGSITPERVTALVQAVAQQRGWLIFYTHDVEDQPSRWGCTPALLAHAVRAALQAGCKVASVAQAIDYFKPPEPVAAQV